MSSKEAKYSVIPNADCGNEVNFVANKNLLLRRSLKSQHVVYTGPFLDLPLDPGSLNMMAPTYKFFKEVLCPELSIRVLPTFFGTSQTGA